MLLVIISVMTVTILTMSYLSSRDNSLAIGQNAIEASSARWSAHSGIELAVAALQTESDWRGLASDGVLINNLAFLDGHLTVHLTDADTGQPPTEETVLVNITAVVDRNGLEQRAEALAFIATSSAGLFQLDLADFALFAEDEVRLSSGGFVGRWESSPRTTFGFPIHVGVRSANSNSIRVSGSSSIVDAWAHYPEGAAYNVVDASHSLVRVETKDVIPLPNAPSSGESHPGSGHGHMDANANVVLVSQMQWDDITVQEGRRMRIPNDSTVVIGNDLTLSRDAHILVESDTTIVVFGDVEMQRNSFIEIMPGASLHVYVQGDVRLDEAYIGHERSDQSVRDRSGEATWFDPERIQLTGFSSFDTNWDIEDTSVVQGSIYAPRARVLVRDNAAVYGRIAAREIHIRGNSSLFFDHTLDYFAGYTNSNSLMYDSDGHIYESFRDMATIDNTLLSDVADNVGLQFRTFSERIGTSNSMFQSQINPLSSDPTPRPIVVDTQLFSVGMQPRNWE